MSGTRPARRAQGGGLARAVGSEEGHDLAGRGGERDVQAEGAAVHDQAGVEAVLEGRGGGVGASALALALASGVGESMAAFRSSVPVTDALIQRSRRPARTAMETASSTRLRATAAAGSFWRAR